VGGRSAPPRRLSQGRAAAEESIWREVEVELLHGDRALLEDVSGRLRAAGLTPSRSSSKLARVLGDFVAPSRPAAQGSRSRARRATAGAVVLAYLQEHADRLVSCDRGVRSDERGAVQDMRGRDAPATQHAGHLPAAAGPGADRPCTRGAEVARESPRPAAASTQSSPADTAWHWSTSRRSSMATATSDSWTHWTTFSPARR